MPRAIDQEKLDSPNTKVLDINNPPLKQIPHQEFPKVVYLHPLDKTKEHLTKVVNDSTEQAEAMAKGWRPQPHVPAAPPDQVIEGYEYETSEPELKRGPGRTRKDSTEAA